jgi:hypothetical protein
MYPWTARYRAWHHRDEIDLEERDKVVCLVELRWSQNDEAPNQRIEHNQSIHFAADLAENRPSLRS